MMDSHTQDGEPPQAGHPQQAGQFITTEHFTLQTARSVVITEINGRTTLYLGTVSSAVVALAFVGQISDAGHSFFNFSFMLFPTLVLLGLVTFVRVIHATIEDILYIREINRIRHFYVETCPSIQSYLLLSTHDDEGGVLHNMGLRSSRGQAFLSYAGMIAAINSILVGLFFGLLVDHFLFPSSWFPILCGGVTFLISLFLHLTYQWRQEQRATQRLDVLFPSKNVEEQVSRSEHVL